MFGAGRRFEMRVVLLVAALLISCGEALSAVYVHFGWRAHNAVAYYRSTIIDA